MTATAAIYHHPDAVERPDAPLAGRRTAGQSFLAGYAKHVDAGSLHCAANEPAHIKLFENLMADYGWRGPIEGRLLSDPERLGEPGTLLVPGPSLGSFAWTRRRVGQAHYAVCGITHTVSTRRVMEGITDVIFAPVESWDCIICTSSAVRGVVQTQLDTAADYVQHRFSAQRVPRPQLPVIPLGIHADQFARSHADRVAWRTKLGIAEADIVILSMGRLTISEKMHPGPLMQAAQLAARATGKRLHLLMAGWFAEDTTKQLHLQMANELAPDVSVQFPDGRDPDLRFRIWCAADIFALPVDNIQETYGLAPVEAMAAGLPVVCSDWNGFRDTIEDGVTGFRVRTLMARPGHGVELARRFESGEDHYLRHLVSVHQRTAVDVRQMADAFVRLVEDSGLREQMGEAGRARVARLFDWAVVIPQYQALWAELTERRLRDAPTSSVPPGAPWSPNSIDPFRLYAGYPTATLSPHARLRAERAVSEADFEHLLSLTGALAFKRMVCPPADLAVIHHAVRTLGPVAYGDLVARTSGSEANLESAILWMAKFDLIQIEM